MMLKADIVTSYSMFNLLGVRINEPRAGNSYFLHIYPSLYSLYLFMYNIVGTTNLWVPFQYVFSERRETC